MQSGSYLENFMDATVAKRVSVALLDELHLQPAQIDSLQKKPYAVLNTASNKALKKVEEDMKAEGKPVAGFGLSWGPILDGHFLPYQPSEPAAMSLSKNIPLLVGSTKTEFTPFVPASRNITLEAAKSKLQEIHGAQTEAYMKAVKKLRRNDRRRKRGTCPGRKNEPGLDQLC